MPCVTQNRHTQPWHGRLDVVTAENGAKNSPGSDTEETTSQSADPAHDDLDSLEDVCSTWLTIPEAADRLGVDVLKIRHMLSDGLLLATRRGPNRVLSIPAVLASTPDAVRHLPGLLTVLRDGGYDERAALRWLLTPDESLGASPAECLASNRSTEIRRRAQAMAF